MIDNLYFDANNQDNKATGDMRKRTWWVLLGAPDGTNTLQVG